MSAADGIGTAQPAALGDPVTWHDAENGAYAADLALFERLAERHGGAIADLGAGTGRVALHLAGKGHSVTAVDTDASLLNALNERAASMGVEVATEVGDARSLDLPDRFALILAPMQLLHIVGGECGRRRVLSSAAAHLEPGGRFAAIVLEEPLPVGAGTPEPIPDVRDVDGWVHSSLPTGIRIDESGIRMTRLRQLVDPAGNLTEEQHEIRLDRFTLAELDRDAEASGMIVAGCDRLPSTIEYEDSIVVLMEARDG